MFVLSGAASSCHPGVFDVLVSSTPRTIRTSLLCVLHGNSLVEGDCVPFGTRTHPRLFTKMLKGEWRGKISDSTIVEEVRRFFVIAERIIGLEWYEEL